MSCSATRLREARDSAAIRPIAGGGGGARAARERSARLPARGGAGQPPALRRRERPDDVLLTRFDAAALVPVLQGRQLLLVHVERASDILQVLALKREFPRLRLVLVGATEGWTRRRPDRRGRRAGDRQRARRSARDVRAARRDPVQHRPDAGGRGPVALGMINDDEARQVRLARQYAGNWSRSAGCPARPG